MLMQVKLNLPMLESEVASAEHSALYGLAVNLYPVEKERCGRRVLCTVKTFLLVFQNEK